MELEGSKYLRTTRINVALTFALCLLAMILVLGWGSNSALFVGLLGLCLVAMFFYAAVFLYKCGGLGLSLQDRMSIFLKGVPYRSLSLVVKAREEGERRSAEILAMIDGLDPTQQGTIKALVKAGDFDQAKRTIAHFQQSHEQREAQDRAAIDALIAEAKAACCEELVKSLAEAGRVFDANAIIKRSRALIASGQQQGIEGQVRQMISALEAPDYGEIERVIKNAKDASDRTKQVDVLRARMAALPLLKAGHLLNTIDELAEITEPRTFRNRHHAIDVALRQIEQDCLIKSRRRHGAAQ
jgi:hypothetical protein